MALGDKNGPIQTIPSGLLGFLQLKNMGRNPSELVDALSPTLQMNDWYFMSRAEQLPVGSRNVANGAVGILPWTTNPLIVPNEEAWWVIDYNVTVSIVTGETCGVHCGWRDPTSFPHLFGTPSFFLNGPAALTYQPVAYGGGIFLPPGSELGVYVAAATTAANIEASGNGWIVRLPL